MRKEIVQRLKCLFTGHSYKTLESRIIFNNYEVIGYDIEVCKKCDKVKAKADYVYNKFPKAMREAAKARAQELAGILGEVPETTGPVKLMELQQLMNAARGLELEKMEIDVESMIKAEDELWEKRAKERNECQNGKKK